MKLASQLRFLTTPRVLHVSLRSDERKCPRWKLVHCNWTPLRGTYKGIMWMNWWQVSANELSLACIELQFVRGSIVTADIQHRFHCWRTGNAPANEHHKQSILPTSHLNKQQKQEVIEYFLAEHHLTPQLKGSEKQASQWICICCELY